MNSHKYAQALYAFRRYLTYYPSGRYASQATEGIQAAERYADSPPPSGPSVAPATPAASSGGVTGSAGSTGKEMSDAAKAYYNAVSLFSQENYQDALEDFKTIVNNAQDREYGIKSLFEIGRCLFSLNNFNACIKHYTTMIKKYPKHPDLADALFYLGNCNEKKGDKTKAESFYKKILSMTTEEIPAHRKAKKALRKLTGS